LQSVFVQEWEVDADLAFSAALLAGLIGASIAFVELVTTCYARTCGLFLGKTWAIWIFSAIYGVIAFGVMLSWDSLVHDGVVGSNGFLAKSYWVRPILVGVCAKAFLHTRLVTIEVNGKPFPVGIETFVRIFEPWLLKTILLDEHAAVQTFLAEPLSRYNNLAEVKSIIKDNIPATLPWDERETVLSDLDKKQKTVRDAMAMFLRLYGPKVFNSAFCRKITAE
jgi:hypothetical protein